jgi:hypothetical protein
MSPHAPTFLTATDKDFDYFIFDVNI